MEPHVKVHRFHVPLQYIGSMSLRYAVELGIPDVIHRHGRPISLPELSAGLAVPPDRSPHLGRLMRLLTHSGIFAAQPKAAGDVYLLTPVSRLLVNDTASILSPIALLLVHPLLTTAFQSLGLWLTGDDDGVANPFVAAHGYGFWDVAKRNPGFGGLFNAAMAGDTCLLLDVLVKDCGDVFRGLTSLVDVGGGTGSAARAISEAFPQVKCSVLDLPQVVNTVAENGTVGFVAGNMFEHIPPANAVLLKWILHDWCDEDCVKILRRCKEAIPCREEGGKVIIVDMVVGSKGSHHASRETQLHWDMLMLVSCGGTERDEQEWKKIFIESGFTDYKITPNLGLRSVIEVYP